MILPLLAKVSCIASSYLRSLISLSYFFNKIVGSNLTLTVASLTTFLILEANFKVDIVSSKWVISGQIFAIKTVLQFPPIESFKIFVNFDYL